MTTESVEDYLKAIYRLEQPDAFVATREIADQLGVASPSVSRMIKRLADRKWVTYHPYQGVRLTDTGRGQALRIVRNHRILETYLSERLGMPWSSLDDEVERLEHVVSDELVNQMDKALGFPRFDPHGSPIPDRNGRMPEPDGSIPLADLPVGESSRIRRIAAAGPEALSYLEERGLKPGAEFRLVRREPLDDLHVLESGRRTVHLGPQLADKIRVAPAP